MIRWIVDASPLIFLAKLDRLDLLRRSADEVLVPEVVLAEVREHDDEACSRVELAVEGWLQPVPQPAHAA